MIPMAQKYSGFSGVEEVDKLVWRKHSDNGVFLCDTERQRSVKFRKHDLFLFVFWKIYKL